MRRQGKPVSLWTLYKGIEVREWPINDHLSGPVTLSALVEFPVEVLCPCWVTFVCCSMIFTNALWIFISTTDPVWNTVFLFCGNVTCLTEYKSSLIFDIFLCQFSCDKNATIFSGQFFRLCPCVLTISAIWVSQML